MHFFSWGWFWLPPPVRCHKTPSIVLQALCLSDLIPWFYWSLLLYNCKGIYNHKAICNHCLTPLHVNIHTWYCSYINLLDYEGDPGPLGVYHAYGICIIFFLKSANLWILKNKRTQESWIVDMFQWLVFFSFHIKKCLIKLLGLSIESSLSSSNIKCWAFISMFCWHMNSNKPGRKHAVTVIPIGPWESHCHDGSSHLHTQLHPQGQGTNRGRIRRKKTMASSSPGWGFYTVTLRHKWNLSAESDVFHLPPSWPIMDLPQF